MAEPPAANSVKSAREGPGFVHLHVHSAYSLLEGAIKLSKLVELAVEDGQPALAVTDRNNLFGALEFSEKAAEKGLQPIPGAKLHVEFADFDSAPRETPVRAYLVLLATNQAGYRNLSRLVSAAHLRAGQDGAIVAYADLAARAEGLIVLSGGPEGPVDHLLGAADAAAAQSLLQRMASDFSDRLYVELQRHGGRGRNETKLIRLAYDLHLPLVATNQPYFASPRDFEAHDALMCIAAGRVLADDTRPRLTPDHCFKTRAEMAVLFADLPEALANTVEIVRRCSFRVPKAAPILPRYPTARPGIADPFEAEVAELRETARYGLAARLEVYPLAPGKTEADYRERLEFELGVIEQMRFPGYFLIVAEFIQWAKSQGIPVGPGRGSGAGSLVAWALTITDIDPMRFSLLFERFLNPERVSMPDFDIDFCQDRRDEVIRHVQEKYGRDQVAQIITFGTLQARAVLRDVGRVLEMPYGQVDRLAKMVPSNPANPVTLKQAIDGEPRLQDAAREEEIVARLFDISQRLEGLYRHASTHAAGIVIADRPLEELSPLYRDPRSDMPVTQFSMKWAEAAGLVKFDFLGLKTLTVLRRAVELCAERSVDVDLDNLPLDDPATFEMLAKGDTVGVFQLESAGMRKALIGMKPDRFEDIIALVALYRPGPMDNIPVYNARKNGEEKPDYIHRDIEAVLRETYGVIIYQEQVMQIAQILSGYSLGEADLLRRAMGKKIREEMAQQRKRFVTGAVARGLTEFKADEIFDLLARFADYGFNKSHAAAYALVSYQTAYMKARHPVEFLAASMQLDIANTDKLAVFRQEAQAAGIAILPPSVVTSEIAFSVVDGQICYALAAIKGVGEGAVGQVVEARRSGGPFRDLTDFCTRLDSRLTNRRTLENLVCAGALDCFGHSRESMIAGIERMMGHASRTAHDHDAGQDDMFAGAGPSVEIRLPAADPWPLAERLHREFLAVGFYLSSHPLDEYAPLLKKMRVQLHGDFEKSVRAGASAGRLAGTVVGKQERRTRQGKKMGILQLSDPSGQYEAVIFEEGLVRYRELLEAGRSVVFLAGADLRPEGVSIRIQSVEPLEDLAKSQVQNLRVFVRDAGPAVSIAPLLAPMAKAAGRSAAMAGKASLVLLRDTGEIEIELPGGFAVNRDAARAIKSVPGVVDVEVV